MSKLGDYVHLTWSGIKDENEIRGGYINFGTYRPSSKHTNFNESIFLDHQNLIAAQIAHLSKSPEELRAIEKEYNDKIKKEQDFFKKLLKNAKAGSSSDKDFILFLLSLIEEQWDPDFIYDHLTFDNQSGLPIVEFPKQKLSSQGLVEKLPKYSGQYKTAGPMANYCKRLAQTISQAYNTQSSKVQKDIKQLQDIADFIIKEIVPYQSNIGELINLVNKNKLPVVIDSKKTAEENLEKILKHYHKQAKTIRSSYRTAESINIELMANFAEIFGNVTTNGMQSILNTYLTRTFEDVKQELLRGQQSSSSGDIMLDFNFLSYKVLQQEFKKNSPVVIWKRDEDKNVIGATLREINSGKSQKADIEINLQAMQGAAISMKTTDLSKEIWKKRDRKGNIIKEGLSAIEIQNSSLLLYLAGAEVMQSNLGTHYLNILTEHKDAKDNALYSQLRKEANSALTLHILWSAFTGAGQARDQGFANIFAVHDKTQELAPGIPRVRFYDMSSVIYAKYQELLKEIEDISLTNDKIDGDETNGNVEDYSFMRITKVIAQAKKMNILVDISNKMLNNIYTWRSLT